MLDRVGNAKPLEEAAKIVSITGTFKWFDRRLRYGFVTADKEMGDVFVHQSNVLEGGHPTPRQGARTTCTAILQNRMWRCVTLVSVDNSTASMPGDSSAFRLAWIKWYNAEKGYGFVTCGPHTPDIFVHATIMKRRGIRALGADDPVMITYKQGRDGLMVDDIYLP